MKLFAKIKLSRRFGRMIYLISSFITVAMAAVVVHSPRAISSCLIIKLLSMPVIYYLNSSFTKGSGMYFYLNLGISRKEYHSIPFVVEFISFILLITICGVIGYEIG